MMFDKLHRVVYPTHNDVLVRYINFHSTGEITMSTGKFVAFRTIAQVADHTDIAGYRDITDWPTLDDAIIGAHDLAAQSTRLARHTSSCGLLVKWAIAQAATIGELGQMYWRTVEVIALSSNGARILHIVSNKSGIAFDVVTPDEDYAPIHYEPLSYIVDYSNPPAYEPYLASDSAMAQLGMMNQVAYTASGKSNDIRNALVSQLGYDEGCATDASVNWRLLDNGLYGWIAELSNGAAHVYDSDTMQFIVPTPRVVLSPAQVNELMLQMTTFSDIVDEGMRLGDIQRCCNASEFVIAISRMLN